MEQSQLLAHCGSSKITREELKVIPTPPASPTHQPLPHYEVVGALAETLSFRQISVVREEYAVSGDGMKMFGVLDLETTFDGCRFSIGVRNSNDKSMRLSLTVGYRVLACDNMAFYGDFTPVLAKHTKHLSLVDILSVGVDRMQRNFEPMRKQVEAWKGTRLTDDSAKLVIYRGIRGGQARRPETLGLARSRSVLRPAGRRVRSANSVELVQRVHERIQRPRPDPAVQDNCEARVVP